MMKKYLLICAGAALALLATLALASCAQEETFDAEAYVGTWTGTFTRDTTGDTNSGTVTMTVTLNSSTKTLTGAFSFAGTVFSQVNPSATISGTYGDESLVIDSTDPLFGTLNVTVKTDGSVSGSGSPVMTVSAVDVSGTATGSSIDVDWSLKLNGVEQHWGTLVMTK